MMRTAIRLLVPLLAITVLASLPALANCGNPAMHQGSALPSVPIASIDLQPFLQAEVNEVATLTAQSNYLRQQGDAMGADLIASYIPDHQMQIARLNYFMDPAHQSTALQPTETPFLGTREEIISHDRDAHQAAVNQYLSLMQQTGNYPVLYQVAMLGFNGADRHFHSLTIAQASISPGSVDNTQTLLSALTLEQAAMVDLRTQAIRLQLLGDFPTANALLSQVPAHQQQIASLQNLVVQNGGNPNRAVPPPSVPLPDRATILAAYRAEGIQLASTYSFPASMLAASPLQQLALNGRRIALNDVNMVSPIA